MGNFVEGEYYWWREDSKDKWTIGRFHNDCLVLMNGNHLYDYNMRGEVVIAKKPSAINPLKYED